jgi:hypothetical protein
MFETDIKCVAVQMAVLLFFVMGIVGWLSGLSPETITGRALGGALAIYVLIRTAGKLVVRLLLRALVNEQIRRRQHARQGQR